MSIGKGLRQAREARNLSLEQVAQATHIRLRFLQALEAEQFELLPSPAQVRGFLRAYASYLKLDAASLLATLDGKAPPSPQAELPAAEPVELPAGSSEAIFAEIGLQLKEQRELLGLSLEDIERHTHIRMHYVRALEAGDLAGLPSPVQGKGMLNNYAGFLGLDTDAMLLRFADGLQARLAAHQPERVGSRPSGSPPRRVKPSILRRLVSPDFLIGGAVILFLIGFAIWGTLRVTALRAAQQATPSALPVAALDTPGAAPTATPTGMAVPGEGTPGGEALATATPGEPLESPAEGAVFTPGAAAATPDFGMAPVQVYVVVHQRTWMRVTVDGELAFEGRVVAGSAYPFPAQEQVELITGNGAGLQVFYNQQDLGLLGVFGEVVQRLFTVQGVVVPTVAVPPTATPMPTATPDPRITPSPTPAVTP